MNLELSLLLSQILAFLIIFWFLKRWAWRPFLKILEERRERIASELNAIDKQKKGVQELENFYRHKIETIDNEARQRMERALADITKQGEQIKGEAEEYAKKMLHKAQADIASEIAQGHEVLKEKIVHLVLQTTEKLLMEKIDVKSEEKNIERLLNEVSLNGEL